MSAWTAFPPIRFGCPFLRKHLFYFTFSKETPFSVAPVADLPKTTAWGGGGYGFCKIFHTAIRPGVFGARGRNPDSSLNSLLV